jgi:uncharacterized protein YbjT (DUF2867 family)
MVGTELLRQLAAEPAAVVHLARRDVASPPPVRTLIVDFAALDSVDVSGDVAYCALGTTIGKAGSRDAFLRVDHDAVIAFAELCKRSGVKTFVLVSSLGADSNSRVFYNMTKGLVEEALRRIGFDHFVAVRPSVLDGVRQESRPGEAVAVVLMRALSPLMLGGLRRYRPSRAVDVAAAMRALARDPGPTATRVVEAEEIPVLAAG